MKKIAAIIISAIFLIQSIPLANAVMGLDYAPKDTAFKSELDELNKIANMEGVANPEDAVSLAFVTVIQKISDGILYVAGPVAILFVAYSGFAYANAMGKQEGIDQAKKGITWALLGLFLVILSYGLVRIIVNLLITAGKAAS